MLVNTCAVRDNAEQRVIGRLGELQHYKRPAACWAWWAAWRSGWDRRCWSRCPRWTSWPGPTPIATSAQLVPRRAPGSGSSDTEFRSWEHYEDVPAGSGDRRRRRS